LNIQHNNQPIYLFISNQKKNSASETESLQLDELESWTFFNIKPIYSTSN